MKAEDIKKILIIGAGTMAAHISTQCVLFGLDVVIFLRESSEKEILLKRIRNEVMQPIINSGFVSAEYAEKKIENISFLVGDPALTPRDVDLVTEVVYEEYEVKEQVWASFAPYLPKHAILTTGSSSLSPSKYADACGAPERFLAWHFYLPAFIRNVTDVMPLPKTDYQYVEIMKQFGTRIHMNCSELKMETPGYLANNMLFSTINTALSLYRAGAADYMEFDRAWMGVRQEASGPFGIMDAAGLDTFVRILKGWWGTTPENIAILEEKVARGELGAKSGKGFYTYPSPEYQKPDFVMRAKSIQE